MRTFFLLFVLVLSGASSAAEPTKANLLAAWEKLQLVDPNVVTLEQIAEREYRFETTHFPYAGTLVVTDVVVDTTSNEYVNAIGYVQVKLPEADVAFLTDHAVSHSIWQRNNNLYWDPLAGEWIGWDEQQARWDAAQWNGMSWIDWLWLILPVVVLLLVIFTSRKANRSVDKSLVGQNEALKQQQHAIELMERNLALHEETNRLLRLMNERLGVRQ